MKLTKETLKRIIKEELEESMSDYYSNLGADGSYQGDDENIRTQQAAQDAAIAKRRQDAEAKRKQELERINQEVGRLKKILTMDNLDNLVSLGKGWEGLSIEQKKEASDLYQKLESAAKQAERIGKKSGFRPYRKYSWVVNKYKEDKMKADKMKADVPKKRTFGQKLKNLATKGKFSEE
tara:strand:- start:805 stop:1341 length:537 start_codon:yes stop_codon:yes gene_type:complete